MTANISAPAAPEERISKLLAVIGQPARVRILFALAAREACVCHLEAALEMRQASISQHLMALRRAGLVAAERDRRNIFYRLCQPAVLEVLAQAAGLSGLDLAALQTHSAGPVCGCTCPHCNPGLDPELTCQKPAKNGPPSA